MTFSDEFPVGTMLTYKCLNPLARPAGDPTITCDENGIWSEISFTCDSVCKAPMSISNSEQLVKTESGDLEPLSGKLFGVGVKVIYRCRAGYYTRRNKQTQGWSKTRIVWSYSSLSAICTQSGKWDFVNPARCKPGCLLANSPEVPNSRLIGPGNRFRSSSYKIGGLLLSF